MELDAISADVVARMERGYRASCRCCRARSAPCATWPRAGRSASPRRRTARSSTSCSSVAGFADRFAVTVSSEEVARGKPAPDVYLEAARGLGADPARCVAIEDSSNGLRAADAAGMAVIAVPNAHYPPERDALALAAATVAVVGDVTVELVSRVGSRPDPGRRGRGARRSSGPRR